jgi:predicted acyl esterase
MMYSFAFTVAVVCLLLALGEQMAVAVVEEKDVGLVPDVFDLPMRDGVKLHTVVNGPIGWKHNGKKYTAVVDRTPYPYHVMEWIPNLFIPFGFVAVGQSMRGTGKSNGNFSMWMSDGNDSEDLGNWIVKQEWSNGKVMSMGTSADGIGCLQTVRSGPSWLSAQFIVWATTQVYEVLFPQGAYKKETTEFWMHDLHTKSPESIKADIQTVQENEMGTPALWDQVDFHDDTYAKVDFPSSFWAGWYDMFLIGNLEAYEGYNTKSAESVRHQSNLVVDPVGHCITGQHFFHQDTIFGRSAVAITNMMQTFGVMDIKRSGIKNITFYVMSSNDDEGKKVANYWTSLETWPKPKMMDFFFHDGGKASILPPSPLNGADAGAKSGYIYDPANPLITNGGNNLPPILPGGDISCGPLDQTENDVRSDVLNFQTDPLDHELALTGPIFATLFVSSDAIDTDFMVRISDVYPDGGPVRLLQDNALRMRWREKTLTPVYMDSGKVYEVTMNLWNTSYVVAPGHALRFSISSSNYPRFSINPNNGLLLADPAYPGSNVTANNVIHHTLLHPSRVSLPVVDKILQLPEVHVIKEAQASHPAITDELISAFSADMEKRITERVKSFRSQQDLLKK